MCYNLYRKAVIGMNELYSMNASAQYMYLEVLFLSLTIGVIATKIGYKNFLEIVKKVVDNILQVWYTY